MHVAIFLMLITASLAGFADIHTTTYNGVPENWYDASPYRKIGKKYYFIEATKLANWYTALHDCRRINGYLASIDSAEEMEALTKALDAEHRKAFWIGANDLGKEGSFHWIQSGEPIIYSKWAPAQPDNAFDIENCAHLFYSSSDSSFLWNDRRCIEALNYICQSNNPKTVSFTVW